MDEQRDWRYESDWREDVMVLHDEARKYERQAVLVTREADLVHAGARAGGQEYEELLRERAFALIEHAVECRRRGDALSALYKGRRP